MLSFATSAVFLAAAVIACGVLGFQLAAALPQAAQLKQALRDCPQTRELRYTIVETMVTPRHGDVVALPARIRPLAAQPKPFRAAA